MKSYMNSFYKGQVTLVLVLGVMVLGLGIGIARFTQLNSSVRESTYDTQREQSYGCSEAGVELAITCLKTAISEGYQGSQISEQCQVQEPVPLDPNDPGTCSYKYAISTIQDEFVIPNLPDNNTEIAVLDGTATSNIDLVWNSPGDDGHNLEVNVLVDNGSGGYDLDQSVYSCGSNAPNVTGSSVSDANRPPNSCGIDNIGQGLRPSIIQLTPRGSDASNVTVSLEGAEIQGYQIVSTGIAGEAQRIITVNYMLPNIARSFNNTFYAGSVSNN